MSDGKQVRAHKGNSGNITRSDRYETTAFPDARFPVWTGKAFLSDHPEVWAEMFETMDVANKSMHGFATYSQFCAV